MNREIKFRGYDKFDKRWVYGYGLHQSIFIDGSSNAYVTAGIREVFIVDKESAGQYTGCKDANDKEIYEGDIVESQRGQNVYIGEVVWFDVGWYIHTELTNIKKDGSKYKYPDYIRLKPRYSTCINKVIGNIYENKNLLEED